MQALRTSTAARPCNEKNALVSMHHRPFDSVAKWMALELSDREAEEFASKENYEKTQRTQLCARMRRQRYTVLLSSISNENYFNINSYPVAKSIFIHNIPAAAHTWATQFIAVTMNERPNGFRTDNSVRTMLFFGWWSSNACRLMSYEW